MLRTQVLLSEEERALLDRMSAETGRSMGALIREAVRARYGTGSVGAADFEAVDAAFGIRSGTEDGEAAVERIRSGHRVDLRG